MNIKNFLLVLLTTNPYIILASENQHNKKEKKEETVIEYTQRIVYEHQTEILIGAGIITTVAVITYILSQPKDTCVIATKSISVSTPVPGSSDTKEIEKTITETAQAAQEAINTLQKEVVSIVQEATQETVQAVQIVEKEVESAATEAIQEITKTALALTQDATKELATPLVETQKKAHEIHVSIMEVAKQIAADGKIFIKEAKDQIKIKWHDIKKDFEFGWDAFKKALEEAKK